MRGNCKRGSPQKKGSSSVYNEKWGKTHINHNRNENSFGAIWRNIRGRNGVNRLRRPESLEERKQLVRQLNSEISRLGEDRKLGDAVQLFKQMLELGLQPTVISYTALLNAYIRSNETTKALGIFKSIVQSVNRSSIPSNDWFAPKRPINANIVTYTTIIKGLCNDGQLTQAWDLLWGILRPICPKHHDQESKNVASCTATAFTYKDIIPNVRCINTYLRGCVRVGDVVSAWVLYKLCTRINVSSLESGPELMDGNSAAMIIKLLSHAQHIDQALEVVNYFKTLKTNATGDKSNGSIENKVESVPKEELKEDDRLEMYQSDRIIKLDNKNEHFNKIDFDLPVDVYIDLGLAFALRGKRKKAKTYLTKAQILLSEPQMTYHRFSEHRSNEQKREIDRIEKFLLSTEISKKGMKMNDFKKIFFFPTEGSRVSLMSLKTAFQELNIEFETDELEMKHRIRINQNQGFALNGLQNLGIMQYDLEDCNEMLSNEQFNMKSIFQTKNNSQSGYQSPAIFKLEICSGSGDWIVQQCQSSTEFVNWIAMELRHDRIFHVRLW